MADSDAEAMDDDERAIELESIAAIFPEMVLSPDSPYKASLEIPVSPATSVEVLFQSVSVPTSAARHFSLDPQQHENVVPKIPRSSNESRAVDQPQSQDVHGLAHLPPLTLQINLPHGYPAKAPPRVELTCTPPWLPESIAASLKNASTRLWEEQGGGPVIFTYIDHLQQSAEGCFGLKTERQQPLIVSDEFRTALLEFDLQTKRKIFDSRTFDCGICLEPKKGDFCHQMLHCAHVFCVDCLQETFGKAITEGDVGSVRCLEPGCGKDSKWQAGNQPPASASGGQKRRKPDLTLHPTELLQIPLLEAQVQRYIYLKRKKKLESDRRTVYCPRTWCQGAARSKKFPKPSDPLHDVEEVASDSDAEARSEPQTTPKTSSKLPPPMVDRLSICEDCNYAFCAVCRRGWHGELICYRQNDDGSIEAEPTKEDKASTEYIAQRCTACPTCDAPCLKTMGCNHMICFRCGTHFCYLCSSYLMEDDPYKHFNTPGHPCYFRLWELEEGVEGEARADAAVPPRDRNAVNEPNLDDHTDNDLVSSDDDDLPIERLALVVPAVPPQAQRAGGQIHNRRRGVTEQRPRQGNAQRGRGARGQQGAVRGNARQENGAAQPQPAGRRHRANIQRRQDLMQRDDVSDSDSTENEVPLRFPRPLGGPVEVVP